MHVQIPLAMAIAMALTALLQPGATTAIQFDVHFGSHKCFTEDVPAQTTLYADIHVSSGTSHPDAAEMQIDFIMTNAYGIAVAHKSGINHEKFTIPYTRFINPATNVNTNNNKNENSRGGGRQERVRICLMHQVPPNHVPCQQKRRITLSTTYKKEAPTFAVIADGARPLTSDHVNDMQNDMQRLGDQLNQILFRIDDIKLQEGQLAHINEQTTRQVVTVSILPCAFIIAVGLLHLEYVLFAIKKRRLG